MSGLDVSESSAASVTPGPLDGIRVVEYGGDVSGPFCGRTLADLGADVVKVEPLDGDPARHHGPFPGDRPDGEHSGLYLFLNANKLGVTLDVTGACGRQVLKQLVAQADVFIDSYPSSSPTAPGLDYAALIDDNPGLIVTSLSPFGLTGPYRDYACYDINVSAAGGMSYGTGFPDREPLSLPLRQSSYLAGFAAALASAMALLSRGETGRGQVVEVSETEVSAVLLNGYHLPTYIYKGVPGRRWGNRMSLGLFPNCVLPASDGHICIDTPQLEQYQRFLQLLGEQPWSENPRYRNRRAMTEEYPEESEALIAPWFRERTKADIFELCRQNRVPCVPVKTIDEVISEPHLRQRGYWQERQQPGIGELTYPGPPYRFPRSPWRLARPAPRLGQHNQEVYCGRLGFSPGELTRLHQAGVV